MPLITYTKDPEAVKDYVLDLKGLSHERTGAESDYLEDGESISSYSIGTAVIENGIEVSDDSQSDGMITFWISGGENGKTYEITIDVVTSTNRRDQFTIGFYTVDQ